MKFRWSVLLFLLAVLAAPSLLAAQEANLTACVDTYDAAVDYFPEKAAVTDAVGFTVEYFNNYKVVTVATPWQGAEEPIQYVLVQCGTPAPEGFADVPVIEVPVQRMIGMSTTFLPHLVSQNLLDQLIAVDSTMFTSTPEVLAKFEAGELPEVGGGGSGTEPDVEQIVDLEPDLVMEQRFSAEDANFAILEQAGLPVVLNADFLETSPLGQAEWGKFISLFFNTEAQAETIYTDVKTRYEDLKALVADVADKPTVLATTPFGDTWYLPGGRSYLAQLLADAGAAYLWADDEATGSLFLDFETVLNRAAAADFWVNTYQTTMADLLAADERFADFAAVENEAVYTNNARQNANGGSEYFETGVANPDIILADLIKIFHPDVLPDHEFYFYKSLSE
ncbi:MAG TPA: ABC transporter substrate-binding protein [Phototrophicaceae bacterium]|nr:ABC transporter substrate-binding protein [Phototrophicaceae bacterium]